MHRRRTDPGLIVVTLAVVALVTLVVGVLVGLVAGSIF